MSPDKLNYRHLLYFWMVAKEGSITRAAERLDLSVQTISTQLGQLERQLGHALLAPQGRSLKLTESGRVALGYAEQIFHLGEQMCHGLDDAQVARPRFAVGITDAVPKLIAFRLLQGVLQPPVSVRLECMEGDFDNLLAELALNRLDMVMADRSAPQLANVKLQSRLLATVQIDLYATPALRDAFHPGFPACLNGAPLLLPVRSDPLRGAIDAWMDARHLHPEVIGEFSDSALLKTFGRAGMGLFPAAADMREDIAAQFGAYPVGSLEGVSESWYAITSYRKIQHPAVAQVVSAAQALLAGA